MFINNNTKILQVTTQKSNTSVDFYKDVNIINYVLNEYVLSNKLVAISKQSEDGLKLVTTLKFTSHEDLVQFLNDPIIKKFSEDKREYNKLHNITILTNAINE